MRSGPVEDWATDFSHTEEEWAQGAIGIWDDLRQRCPIAHTERFGGAWLPTRYEDVAAIAYDTEHFTSRAIIVSNVRPPMDVAPVGLAWSTDCSSTTRKNRVSGTGESSSSTETTPGTARMRSRPTVARSNWRSSVPVITAVSSDH